MRRGFVDATYRSRALWAAFFMSVIAITNAANFVPIPNDALGSALSFAPFLALVIVCFVFVDKSILVAVQTDFFHRNTLRWLALRRPALTSLVLSSAVIMVAVLSYGSQADTPLWVNLGYYQFFLVSALVLGVAVVALIVGSRRTPDKTLKKHIRLLGYALAFFVVSLVAGFSASDAAYVASEGLTLFATYFLYLSTMSLTSLGRVEKDA